MPIIDNDALIRDRAYDLWEKAGRPNGREHEHWAEACRQIDLETAIAAPPTFAVVPEVRKDVPDEGERLRRALYAPEPFSFELFGGECPAVDLPIVLHPKTPAAPVAGARAARRIVRAKGSIAA